MAERVPAGEDAGPLLYNEKDRCATLETRTFAIHVGRTGKNRSHRHSAATTINNVRREPVFNGKN